MKKGLSPVFLVLTFTLLVAWLPTSSWAGVPLKGQRLKVTGQWDGKQLRIYKVRFRDARKNPKRGKVIGIIANSDPEKKLLRIGPLKVSWYAKTRFSKLTPADLRPGVAVQIRVSIDSRGKLIARDIRLGPDDLEGDEIQILGTVSDARPVSGDRNVIVILGASAIVDERLTNPTLQLTRRQDDFRPDDQLTLDVFGRPLIIGGEFGFTNRYQKDFKLDPNDNDDRLRLNPELQLEFFYSPAKMVAIFLEGQATSQIEPYKEGGRDKTVERKLRRGETWLFWGDVLDSGFSLQLGRQNYQDRREWWWDANLDSFRVYYLRPHFLFQVAAGQAAAVISTDLDGIESDKEDVLRILSSARWQWDTDHALSLFFMHQLDHSDSHSIGQLVDETQLDVTDAQLTWGGIRASGQFDLGKSVEVEYWLDTALTGGRESLVRFDDTDKDDIKRIVATHDRDVFGGAVDVGLTMATDLPLHPSFTFSYAFGSREFQQTGLQDNNVRFRGVDRFRLYGELLRPELSNLHIWTVSAGIPLLASSSLELLYHKYSQVEARPFLRNTRLKAAPSGNNRDIGDEVNVVLGLEEWKRLELEFVFGVFWAGSAFGKLEGKSALTTILKMNYNF